MFICEMWLFDLSFFLNSANLIYRDTDISKYFRESLGLRDNESRLYMCFTVMWRTSIRTEHIFVINPFVPSVPYM